MVSMVSTRSYRSDSKTCVVPLFLSTKGQRSMHSQNHKNTARSQRSHTSTRDVIAPDAPAMPHNTHSRSRRAESPSEQSDLYAAYPPPQRQDTSTASLPTTSTVSSNKSQSRSASSSSSSSRPRKPHAHQTRKRKVTSRTARLAYHIATKKRLTISFGITFLAAAIIYLALFVSKAAKGALFHIMSILLLLSLAAIAAHSLVRWLMLRGEYRQASERRDRKRKTPRERGWAISRPYDTRIGGKPVVGGRGYGSRVLGDDEVPERAFPVFMREDEAEGDMDMDGDVDVEEGRLEHGGVDLGGVGHAGSRLEGLAGRVRPPPPVYGNLRNSVRMNPQFLHVHEVDVPPGPSTPTYEEAVSQSGKASGPKLPGMAGYRPPSYGSEGGLTAVLETRRRDVEEAIGRIHPLERERLDRLGFRG